LNSGATEALVNGRAAYINWRVAPPAYLSSKDLTSPIPSFCGRVGADGLAASSRVVAYSSWVVSFASPEPVTGPKLFALSVRPQEDALIETGRTLPCVRP